MKFDVTNWTRLAILSLVASSFISVGCSTSSGWKMPTPKMFSWSKKPSETTLAGAGPSAIKYPDSPASKQSPQAIASAAAGTAPKPGMAGPGASAAMGTGARGTQPTYTPPNGMSNVAFAPPAAAAAANGYSVGPYNTYSQPGAAANALASSGVPNGYNGGIPASGMSPSNPFSSANAGGLPSTQMYSGATPGALASGRGVPQFQAGLQPSNVGVSPGSMPPGAMPPGAMPGMTAGSMPNSFAAASSSPNAGLGASPIASNAPNFTMPQTMPAASGYTPVGSSNMANSQSSSFPGASSASGSSVPGQMAAYNMQSSGSGLSTASFRPGSTGRQTNYDFSQPAPSTGVAGQGIGMPAASSATGTNNPGFQVPPAATYR